LLLKGGWAILIRIPKVRSLLSEELCFSTDCDTSNACYEQPNTEVNHASGFKSLVIPPLHTIVLDTVPSTFQDIHSDFFHKARNKTATECLHQVLDIYAKEGGGFLEKVVADSSILEDNFAPGLCSFG
jgi:hypothetical protein